jgi:ribonuclease P protein component
MPYAYRKSERLRKNSEFVLVMKKGKRLSVDGLSLFYAENGAEDFRVGISVSKKLANAVVRNRLRRQVRACVSLALRGHALGYDLVFMARSGLVGAAYSGILKAVQTALARSVLRSVKPEGANP